MSNVTFPVINLNGSDPEALVEALRVAHQALRAASTALEECTPHGRDYQHRQDWPLAQKQHRERQSAVRTLMSELEEIAADIQRQQDERKRQKA